MSGPCPAVRDWCGYAACGETALLSEFDRPQQPRAVLEKLSHDSRWALARCLSGVALRAEDTERAWRLHLGVSPNGRVELVGVRATRWSGGEQDGVLAPGHRECFASVLGKLRLDGVTPRSPDVHWSLVVGRRDD